MPKTLDIDVHHITRVEGHGNIRVRATDGTIEQVEWQVPEAPRFFEAMVRGRSYADIQTIVSRICGICSVSHSLTALKAVECAMGVQTTAQTDKIRLLLHYGEQLESHVLHVGYLIAPDLLGQKSVVPLASSHLEEVKTIIRGHKMGNKIMEVIGGRMTHPVSAVVGGFAKLPSEADLLELKAGLVAVVPDLKTIAAVVKSVAGNLPAFERPTEYVSLRHPDMYSFYGGDVVTTDNDEVTSVQDWESVTNEHVVSQSTAKWCKWHRDSYAVGSLARFNNNAEQLLPLATSVADDFGLVKGCCNPYMNNVAQVVEAVQVVEHSLQLIEELLSDGIKAEKPDVTPAAGNGAGCTEAPRGILFHRYQFDDKGVCEAANICIPTGQNHANIQKDFEALVPAMIEDKTEDEIRHAMEMLVRAYDPCISCSTHYLNVEFV